VERFVVGGRARLVGEVSVDGAKNSVLKLMAATLLSSGRTVIGAVPEILDVTYMTDVLAQRGGAVTPPPPPATVTIDVPGTVDTSTDNDNARRMRASTALLGPLVARCGEARVALPGGDAIGARGLDMHMSGLERLGARVAIEDGYIVARASRLTAAPIWLEFPSVGATENLLMAAVLARGTTVIDNAAREPEIVDLAAMLTSMGARIGGAGTATLEVEGVETLSATTHDTVPDRIVAGTWAAAAVMTQGDVFVRSGRADHLVIPLEKLVAAGAEIDVSVDGFRVRCDQRPRAVDVVTLPYPGFPTDLQAAIIALAAVSEGTAMITENVFDARWMFARELSRLGADIRTDGHHAVVRGREVLHGASVQGSDVRAGAALVLAGLVADSPTEVAEIHHVDRGYARFAERLRGLGADVRREPQNSSVASLAGQSVA
jgi:UDP-N-acetylglucosamine 1-carboxyvinyltransferase